MNNNEPGLLLVGHGTRSVVGTRQFLDLAQVVAGRLSRAGVQPAFLELQEPTIEQGIERLAAAGVERVVVVPLLRTAMRYCAGLACGSLLPNRRPKKPGLAPSVAAKGT